MTPIRLTITGGSLAAELDEATRKQLAAKNQLEDLLDSLFQSWLSYDAYGATLDVFGVIPSTVATATLQRAGFALIYLHPHPATDFVACECRAR